MKVSRRDNVDRYYLVKFLGFGVFVHRIHHDEQPGVFHNHPWSWVSIIFGSYVEELPGKGKFVRRWWNVARAKTYHRVELPRGPVWTLFFHGRRSNQWSVADASGKVINTELWRGVGGPTSYTGN